MLDERLEKTSPPASLAAVHQNLLQGDTVEPWTELFDGVRFGLLVDSGDGHFLHNLVDDIAVSKSRQQDRAEPSLVFSQGGCHTKGFAGFEFHWHDVSLFIAWSVGWCHGVVLGRLVRIWASFQFVDGEFACDALCNDTWP